MTVEAAETPGRLRRRPWRVNSAAWWATAAPLAGAVFGLLIALPSVFHPLHRDLLSVPDGAAALVNQRPILVNDYVTQVETETSAPFDQVPAAKRAQVLREMIDEELMVERGLAVNLAENDTDVRAALVHSLEAQVIAPLLAIRVDESALRAFYAAHRVDYATAGRMRIRNLVLHVGGFRNADQSVAQATQDVAEAGYQLRAGAALESVMAHYGLVDAPHADTAIQFDFAAKLHLGDGLYNLATTMVSGDISDPVALPDGVHMLIMDDRMPPHVNEFDHVRAAVYTAYRKVQEAQAEATNIALLRSTAQIILAPNVME